MSSGAGPLGSACARLGRGRVVLTLIAAALAAGCGQTIPAKYLKQAEPGVTLTVLASRPEAYRGKVVLLGGVVVEHREAGAQVWLHMKNRPLDEDYEPHLPIAQIPSEAGYYWVAVPSKNLPKTYRNWAQVTVVGRVASAPAGSPASGREPVLHALFLRGWGGDSEESIWEQTMDAHYLLERPPATREN
jgi:hypothetical protein